MNGWKFGWNRWIGIMYGPIPIGLIVGAIVLIAVYAGGGV